MLCSFSELKDKEVVNIRDGKKLGCVIDVEFDIPSGRLMRLVLPPPGKFIVFGSSKNNLYIAWDHIEKIGSDIILVRCSDIIPSKNK